MSLEMIDSLAAPAANTFNSDHPCAWTKRKRSRRSLPFCPCSEDEHLALCLVMLAQGRKASHEKASHCGSSASTEDDGNSGISSALLLGGTRRSHECSICGKSFASGQALGGHKRSHIDRSGGKRVKGSVTAVSETSGGPKFHDFDLNLLPPVEEEESPYPYKKARPPCRATQVHSLDRDSWTQELKVTMKFPP